MIRYQKGMTFLGVLMVTAVIAFFAYVGIKLAPVYLENFGVNSSLKSLAEEEGLGASAGELRSRLLKRLEINNVSNVSADHIKIRPEGGSRVITIDYEVRTRFYGNLYLVAAFSDRAVLPGN